MFTRKNLFVVIFIFLGVTVYFLITNINAQSLVNIPTSIPNDVDQNKSQYPSIHNNSKPQIKQTDSEHLICTMFEQANKIDKKNKASFISTKAIQWYFDGFDKYKIAKTLAAKFGYSVAMQWIKTINRLSSNHDSHNQLIQTIDSLSYTSNFVKSSKYMKNISHYQLDYNPKEGYQIDQRFNLYPDLAIHHWETALDHALQNKNYEDVLNAIKQLKTHIDEPVFFKHPLKNLNTFLPLSSFPQQEIEMIIEALFDLAPIFIESGYRFEMHLKQMLEGLDFDKSLWRFMQISRDEFKIDPTINAFIEKVLDETPSLDQKPRVENYCLEENINQDYQKIKVKKLNLEQSKQQLSTVWQGVLTVLCPEKTIINGFITVKRKLNASDIFLEDLTDFEKILMNSAKLRKVISEFDEYERTMFFSMLYREKQFNLRQINDLISRKISPISSDFYFLIRKLTLIQQKELLLEQQFNLTNSNGFDFSIITSILQFGSSRHTDELIPFLVEQGFPLKTNESSPDPLWTILFLMSVDNRYREIPVKSISTLIDHTKMNETHIDIMYNIKQKNIKLYKNLVEEFSELKFDAPEELIDLNCY